MMDTLAIIVLAYLPWISVALGAIATCAVYEFFFMPQDQNQ